MNYKQTSLSGDSWVRASSIMIDNPLAGVPVIRFIEDKILNLENEVLIKNSISTLVETFTTANSNTEFNLRNPETSEIIGTSTYSEIYVILHSLYMHLAEKRDLS